eukprot:TRINITY_DN84216_c0_g1_i1.p1 TRINITY_DN84216_c0_g1~~TRINITY_DN84216_c0_g1_i1.p1  ORF type:complete len:165 (+),score=30.16 TRINITY_DN84216_c0_g1_i1:51-545(+)
MAQQYDDITGLVDATGLECLNQKPANNIQQIFPPTGMLESDTDAELLMVVPFKETVKVHDIDFISTADGRRPNAVRIFCNNKIIDFDDAANTPATQEAALDWKQHSDGKMIAHLELRFVKFQMVTFMTLFFPGNVDDEDTTTLTAINFAGQALQGMDVNKLKKG